jgi:putative SOS response-associated peptidase YedK
MCGRFTLSKPDKINKRFKIRSKHSLFDASYNIAPSQTLPVVVRKSPNRVVMMKWGFIWDRRAEYGTINIRKESFSEKPFFRKFLLGNRCLIPADGFYEWRKVKLEQKEEKYPFFISLKDNSLFGFAGIYNEFKDAEGKPLYYFAIITCNANRLINEVHDRMPVILERKKEDEWLDSDQKGFDKLDNLMKPYSSMKMKLYSVSKRVNSPRNDDADLIKEFNVAKLPF